VTFAGSGRFADRKPETRATCRVGVRLRGRSIYALAPCVELLAKGAKLLLVELELVDELRHLADARCGHVSKHAAAARLSTPTSFAS